MVASDEVTGDRVAIKSLRNDRVHDHEMLLRFAREAEVGAQLVHPNIARLRALETTSLGPEGVPYLVFDCIAGLPLGAVLAYRDVLRPEEALHIMVDVLAALEAAHARGVVHRDLKPDNILLAPPPALAQAMDIAGTVSGRLGIVELDHEIWQDVRKCSVHVVDFGLSKLLEIEDREVEPLTRAGMTAGTAHYISPEQVAGETIDYRTDLYGAGVLLWTLLTGRPPFDDAVATTVALRHLKEPLPALPEPLEAHPVARVIARATEKRPSKRFATAGEMAWALATAFDPTQADTRPEIVAPPRVRRASTLSRLTRWLRD
jgi:serine/threonine-protein kinase